MYILPTLSLLILSSAAWAAPAAAAAPEPETGVHPHGAPRLAARGWPVWPFKSKKPPKGEAIGEDGNRPLALGDYIDSADLLKVDKLHLSGPTAEIPALRGDVKDAIRKISARAPEPNGEWPMPETPKASIDVDGFSLTLGVTGPNEWTTWGSGRSLYKVACAAYATMHEQKMGAIDVSLVSSRHLLKSDFWLTIVKKD